MTPEQILQAIVDLELGIEWYPKVVWVSGKIGDPVGVKRNDRPVMECLEQAVAEHVERSCL